jgi:Tfp pilus assembly protein PilF
MKSCHSGAAVLLLALAGCVTTGPFATHSPPPAEKARARELSPAQAAEVCWATAEELRKRGYEAEAIAQYEKVREHAPDYPQVAWRLAVLYDRQGDAARSSALYQQALQVEPRNPDLLNDLGYFYYQREDWAQAEHWLREALAVDPKHARANVNLGLTLGRQGRANESLECFARVLPPAQAMCNVGVLLSHLGRREDARRFFEDALRQDRTLTQARAFLAWLDGPPGKAAPVMQASATGREPSERVPGRGSVAGAESSMPRLDISHRGIEDSAPATLVEDSAPATR